MKKITTLLFTSFSVLLSFSQSKNITAHELKTMPDNSIIYISALWCSPCIEKQNMLEDSLKNKVVNYMAIYDKMNFTESKKNKLIKIQNSKSSKIFLIDEKYYAARGKVIQIKSPKKALKNFYKDLEMENFQISKERPLWFGDCIVKTGNTLKIISSEKKTKVEFVNAILNSVK